MFGATRNLCVMELSRLLEEPATGRTHLPPRRAKQPMRKGRDSAGRSHCCLWALGLASAAMLVLLLRRPVKIVGQDAGSESASSTQPRHTVPTRHVGYCSYGGWHRSSRQAFAGSWEVEGPPDVVNCTYVGTRGLLRDKPGALLFTMCARNVEGVLRNRFAPQLDALLELQPAAAALVFHDGTNDSSTRSALVKWASRNARVRLILADEVERGVAWKMRRLTMCRNTLLGEADATQPKDSYIASVDIDCDHRNFDLLMEQYRTMRALGSRYYDVATTNNPGPYRDMWALRSERLNTNYDCFYDESEIKRHDRTDGGHCKMKKIVLHRDAPPFEVNAAFNGATVYRMGSIHSKGAGKCRAFHHEHQHWCVEHVPYQLCLRRHGVTIAIVPRFVTFCHWWMTNKQAHRWYMLPNGNMSLPILRSQEPGFVRPHKTEPDWQGMHEPWCTVRQMGPLDHWQPFSRDGRGGVAGADDRVRCQ